MNMNRLNNRAKTKRNMVKSLAAFCVGLLAFGFASCDDELDVMQAYPFTVETMPVPKELAKGETAEIRCELVREGEFEKFRLYYTSECDESQSLTITVEDNFGNSFEWETDFNNDSDAEEAPSGNDTLNTVKGGVYQ